MQSDHSTANKDQKNTPAPLSEAQQIKQQYSEQEIRRQMEEFGQSYSTPREKINLLYLDDDQIELDNFYGTFRREFKVFITPSAKEAQQIVSNEKLHVILTDQRMPEMTGTEFLKSIIATHPDPTRILITGYSDMQATVDAINQGQIFRYIDKPFGIEEMRHAIITGAEQFFLKREKNDLIQKLARANSQLDFMLRQKILGEDL